MDTNADKNIIAAFGLGVLVCAVLLSPLWLFDRGITSEEAADIVVQRIYTDFEKENHVVEVTSAEEVGMDLYRVHATVKEIKILENISYLVRGDGVIIRESGVDKEAGQAGCEEPSAPAETVTPTGSPGRTVEGVHAKGPEDAKVTIIEYSDFQCPYCARFYNDAYQQILANYPNDVKIIFKDFPLSFHAQATPAAEAAECAGAQGKYWEYHDVLFEKQDEWASVGRASYDKYAEELGLDMETWANCVNNREFRENVQADFLEGQQKGVRGTPAFFINDKLVSGAQPFAVFQAEIDAALAAAG
jgi:protein-disulfide isomerase